MTIEKRIAYKEGSSKPESPKPPHEHLNGNVISIFPIPHEKPWYENGKTKAPEAPEGIMRVASARGDREYLISVLSRYYTPRDLYYKNIKELNQMLQMHLTESGGLI